MHILFLSDNFPPEVNAPASRTFEHCRTWAAAGHRVTVITCAPNFPGGKVFGGYRNRLLQTERMDGIRVIRVWSYLAANAGFFRRVADYLSYMFSAVAAALFVPRPDVVVGTSPQFFTACGAYAVGRLKRVPFVFELRDLWPESIKAVGAMEDSAAIRMLEKVERFLYEKADRIVAVTGSFKKILVGRGIRASKIEVVPNGVDHTRFRPMARDAELVGRHALHGKFTAGYIGTHGLAHGLETILDAAARIRREKEGGDYRFLFLGNGARKGALMEKSRAMGLDNTIFIDTVAKEEVVRYWSLLDVSIIHLRKKALFASVIPSKLFEGMGMGVPVLHGVTGESAEIVEKVGAGMLFEPENSPELVARLLALRADPVLRGRMRGCCLAGAGRYDRSVMARRMLAVLEAAGRS